MRTPLKASDGQKLSYVYYEEEAGRPINGEDAQQRRGTKDRSEFCEAAKSVAKA
jgi:hypothetical protein